jgi:hypothetical protein
MGHDSNGVRFRAKVFVKDGNRFLVPGYWYDTDDLDASPANISLNAMMFAVVLGMEVERDWLEVEADGDGTAQLPNVPYTLVGRQFEHGATDVLLIDGPLFTDLARTALESVRETA